MPELAPPQFPHGFPLRTNCDPDDPYQAFLWMLVALPQMQGGQLVMPVEYLQQVSKRLWDLGARPVAEPVLKYRKPASYGAHWLLNPGAWVDVDEPDDDPRSPSRRAADSMIPVQKAEMFLELTKDMTPKERYAYGRAMMKDAQGLDGDDSA